MANGGDDNDGETQDTVPTVDTDDFDQNDQALDQELLERSNEAEFRALKAENARDRYIMSDWRLQQLFRAIAMLMSLFAVMGGGVLIYYLVEKVFWGPLIFVNTAFSVVIITAPILAITTIVSGFLLAAFRRDSAKSGNLISDAAQDLVKSLEKK